MILGPYELKTAPKFGLQLAFRGDSRYLEIIRSAFRAPARWFGPYESFDPHFDWVLYGHEVAEQPLRSFLEFASTTLFIPAMLDECWALSLHMAEGGRTELGELAYQAKTYAGKPGDPQAAEELARILSERIGGHPLFRSANGVVGVPSYPPKEPHNLPELLAARLAAALGLPFREGLIAKLRFTEIKNLSNEDKLEALTGAFEVRNAMNDETIIVVDDLIRSGSTLGVIADLLRRNGAGRVIGVAITKTVRD